MSIATRILATVRRGPGGIRARVAAVVGLVVFALLAGTSTSFAYFQFTQGASATATAGTLAVSTSNFGSLAYTFRNDQLDTVGSVTVTNTSDAGAAIARSVSIVFSATGDTKALGAVRYIVSAKGSAACAAKNTVAGGTLTENQVGTTWSTTSIATPSLAPGASVTYCVESYVRKASDLADTDGALTLTPKVAASLSASSWTAATSATTSEPSAAIYPAFTSMGTDWSYIRPANVSGTRYCLDVSGAADADGTHVISWACKTGGTSNQIWKFVADSGYYSLQSNNAQSRRAEQAGTGTGSLVYTNTATTATTQDWQVQQISTGLYQLVNRSSGLCASATNPSGDVTLQQCTDAAATQRFVVSPYLATASCTFAYSNQNGTRITLNWTTANTQTLKYYVGGAQVTPVSSTSTSATLAVSGTATQTVQITDSTSALSAAAGDTLLATGSVTPGSSGSCGLSNMVN